MKFKSKDKERPGTGKRPKFQYRPRTADEVHQRQHQQGGAREGFVRSDVKTWQPKEGENTIRLLPPTWDGANAIGYQLFAHYQIGPDNSSYLCLEQMKKEPCPICEERMEADKRGDDDVANELKPKKRVAVYIIDRAQESKGPQLWVMPWTVDRDIAALMFDKKTKGVLAIDSPEDGYDVSFEKVKKAQFFEYTGVQIDRRPSPLSEDEDDHEKWMQYIIENPIPDVLQFAEYDHIREAFGGEITESKEAKKAKADKAKAKKAKDEDDEDDEDDKPAKRGTLNKKPKGKPKDDDEDEDDDKPAKPKKKAKGLPTWEEVHELDEEDLTALAEEHEVDLDQEFDSLEDAADHICEELGIEKPKTKKKAKDDDEDEDEEDEPKRKKKAKDDDEDEAEEDEPKRKKKAKDDDEDEDDEEDEPKRKKKAKDDDEDEDDEEDEPKRKSWKDKIKKLKK
jgi:hypothetical protein